MGNDVNAAAGVRKEHDYVSHQAETRCWDRLKKLTKTTQDYSFARSSAQTNFAWLAPQPVRDVSRHPGITPHTLKEARKRVNWWSKWQKSSWLALQISHIHGMKRDTCKCVVSPLPRS
jgi:hypothetical protein